MRYVLRVVTGELRGAGTSKSVYVTLVGTGGQTRETELLVEGAEGYEEPELVTGSTVEFTLDLAQDVGDIKWVTVRRDEPRSMDTDTGWYLDTLELTGPDGATLNFPCQAWFGESQCGGFDGPNERSLPPCAVPTFTEYHSVLEPLTLKSSAVAIPHPNKVLEGNARGVVRKGFGHAGEDAYFAALSSDGLVFGMGVADGVYWWRTQGIDSGVLSRKLCELAKKGLQWGIKDALSLMQYAAARCEERGLEGSSTFCILLLDTYEGRLTSANIGDSGYLVLANQTKAEAVDPIKFRTPQQEHDFGTPFQLGHHEGSSAAEDAALATVPVERGDVVVMGSDGLFDNVADKDIAAFVAERMGAMVHRPLAAIVADMAQGLAKIAYNNSISREAPTPYAKAATEHFDMVYSGGKKDDITVVVAIVD